MFEKRVRAEIYMIGAIIIYQVFDKFFAVLIFFNFVHKRSEEILISLLNEALQVVTVDNNFFKKVNSPCFDPNHLVSIEPIQHFLK